MKARLFALLAVLPLLVKAKRQRERRADEALAELQVAPDRWQALAGRRPR